MNKDQVFVPPTASESLPDARLWEWLEDAPLLNLFYIAQLFLLGWPAYILTNVTAGHPDSGIPAGWNNHFNPSAVMFTPEQRPYVIYSSIGVGLMLLVLGVWGYIYGLVHLTTHYLLPYLGVNFWLIMYTFLQHSDTAIPHYSDAEWTFIRGALATVDRPYQWYDFFHHHIGTTHVCHHFFSRIPHYHAAEATRALKKVLGKYYLYDATNIWVACWRQYCECKFVAGEGGILWFKKSFRHCSIKY